MTKPTDVGPDPIKWIERLQDVNGESQFTPMQRDIVARGLHKIKQDLKYERAFESYLDRPNTTQE